MHETLRLMESLGIWTDEMLRLSPRLDKVLRLGASVQRFIRSGQPPTAAPSANAERIFL